MKTRVPADEATVTRRRTRWAMGVSAAVHAVLLALLLTIHPAPPRPPLTEIDWLEPGDAAAAEPAGNILVRAGGPAPRGDPGAVGLEQRFERETRSADFEPSPQSTEALDDRLTARLAALQGTTSGPSVAKSAGVPDGVLGAPAVPSGVGVGGGGTGPIGLNRGGSGGGGTGLVLSRGGGGGGGRALQPAVPASARQTEAAQPAEGDANARRVIAGAQLIGPVADRAVLTHVLPVYPEWAKHDGVEGVVTLYFVVRADGTVRENVLVQRTAGFEDFDENARVALRAWRFEPLRGGRTGEQWGTITFQYRLRDLN